VQGTK
jgi:hypothetical protein